MKTLYLSDLDGTLLGSNDRVSERTLDTVNRFIKEGGCFSYATARSIVTATKATAGLNRELPVICHNGTFIFGRSPEEILLANYFASEKAAAIRRALREFEVLPMVYSFIDGKERFSFLGCDMGDGLRKFLDSRIDDPRRRQVKSEGELFAGQVFYVTCKSDAQKLDPIYDRFKQDGDITCLYQRDLYSDAQLLELMPEKATKANAALQLKTMLGCDRLIVFGDGLNDMSLFSVADECYAMENAAPELKEIATAVIGSNDIDGVALWLEENAL